MSLDNIQLPPLAIEGLFKKTLVELKTKQQIKATKAVPAFHLLGKNKKGVVVLIHNDATAFLPEEELNFLIGILSACQLTLEDAGIINMANSSQLNYHHFEKEIVSEKILLFGVAPAALELPLSFPHYQIQAYNNHTYLAAPALAVLMQHKAEKLQLWNCLKLIFGI
jgi:hypothetical protein